MKIKVFNKILSGIGISKWMKNRMENLMQVQNIKDKIPYL